MRRRVEPPSPPPGWVGMAEAVRISGLSRSTLHRWIQRGLLPALRIRGRVYLREASLRRPPGVPFMPGIPLAVLVRLGLDAEALRRVAVRWRLSYYVPLHELMRLLGVLTPPPWPFDWGPSGPPRRVEPVTANGVGLLVGVADAMRRVGRGDWLLVRCFGDRPALVLQAPPPGEAVVVLPGESGEGPGVWVEGPDGLSVRLRPDLVVSVPREAVVGGLGVAPPEVLRAVGW